MLKIGYTGEIGIPYLSIDDGVSSININKPRSGDTYYIGYMNKNGIRTAVYLEVIRFTKGKTSKTTGIEVRCTMNDYETMKVTSDLTLHLSTSWHEFKELEDQK